MTRKHPAGERTAYHPLTRSPLPPPVPAPKTVRFAWPPALMTYDEAAYHLSRSRREVERLVQRGVLTPIHDGRMVRFHRDDLDAYAASLRSAEL